MTALHDQDLTGAQLEDVTLDGAHLQRVSFRDATMRDVDLTGADLRSVELRGTRLRGAELVDTEINGELLRVVVNGVDIAPLVEAELDRRMPERAAMRPDDPEGFREAWRILERRWDETIARAKTLPETSLHVSVDGEWSFIETLRHLNFAIAAWVGRMLLGDRSPWHRLDLPWDEAPGWEGIPWDRTARPSLDEVLAVRRERHEMVRGVLDALTVEQLSAVVSQSEPGWPVLEAFPFQQCLRIVLNEEWEHRSYAERDLALVERSG